VFVVVVLGAEGSLTSARIRDVAVPVSRSLAARIWPTKPEAPVMRIFMFSFPSFFPSWGSDFGVCEEGWVEDVMGFGDYSVSFLLFFSLVLGTRKRNV